MMALTKHLKGGLKVGDSLSRLNSFAYGRPKPYKEGCHILFYTSDNPVYLLVDGGIITGVDYSEPL